MIRADIFNKSIEEQYNAIFGKDSWREDKDMYIIGAYFLEPNFNFGMGGMTEEERDKQLKEYNAVDNGEIDAFDWLREHGKFSSDVIFDLCEKGEHIMHECRNGLYYYFDNSTLEGLELDIFVPTKADAIRIFKGEW